MDVTVVTKINLAICWKLRVSDSTRNCASGDVPQFSCSNNLFSADYQQERFLISDNEF